MQRVSRCVLETGGGNGVQPWLFMDARMSRVRGEGANMGRIVTDMRALESKVDKKLEK